MAERAWLVEAKKNSGFLIFLGVLTVIFGIMAVGAPLITGVAVSMFVGFLLLGSGIAQVIHAFKAKQWGTGFWGTIIGLLGAAAGLVMIFRPVFGLSTLTLLLAFYFLIDGISEIIAAFKIKPDQGWGWLLFNGIIAFVLGLMIWRQWPVSGAWAIGLLVGIHILMTGWSMIILGTGTRKIAGAVEGIVGDAVEATGDLAEDVADKAEDVVEKVGDIAENTYEKAEDAVEGVVDKAKDAFDRDKD